MEPTCGTCGRPTDAHDRHVRFRLPDPLVGAFDPQSPGVWMSGRDPLRADMMQHSEAGPFIRALLPVALTGGFTVTFGVWVGVHPDDLQRAFSVWHEPEYAELTFDGFLANRVGPWDVLGAPVHLVVRSPDQIPVCGSSEDRVLRRILADTWPHEDVLASLPA